MEAPVALTPKPKEIKEFRTQLNEHNYTISLSKTEIDDYILLEIKDDLSDYYGKFNQIGLSSIIKEFKLISDLNEIYEILFDIIINSRFNIIESNENLKFIVKICKINGKEKEYELILNPKPITNEKLVGKMNELKNKVASLEKIINKQNNIIEEQNIKIKKYEDKLEKYDERLMNLENILKQRKIESNPNLNDVFKNFNLKNDLAFLIKRLEKNGKIQSFNLLYSAEKDGDKAVDFHNKCDNINDTLIILKTENNVIFGGFTHMAWNSSGIEVKDNRAFCFSINNQKIYNVKKNKTAIFCADNYGPSFFSHPFFIIYLGNEFLSKKGNTCKKSNSFYDGLDTDYEINNGDEFFYIKQLEVYKVKFQ